MIKSIILLSFIGIFSSLYLTVNGEVYGYNVTVTTTSDKDKSFTSHTGKFKVEFRGKTPEGKNFSHYVVLNPEGSEIQPNRSYSFVAASPHPLESINEIFLRWTLKSPFNPYHLINKPKIYFDRVAIQSNRIDRGITTQGTKIFCSKKRKAIGIKHDEGEILETCVPISFYPIPGLQ